MICFHFNLFWIVSDAEKIEQHSPYSCESYKNPKKSVKDTEISIIYFNQLINTSMINDF